MTDYALAVDLGGTKVEAALVESDGTLVPGSRHRRPTGATATSDELARSVTEAVQDAVAALVTARRDDRVIGVGIGSAGPLVDERQGPAPRAGFSFWRGDNLAH